MIEHYSPEKDIVKIGIIEGAGTGTRLIKIFKNFLLGLSVESPDKLLIFEEDLDERECPHIYHSYKSLSDFAGHDTRLFNQISREEVKRLLARTKKWYEDGVRVVFRTSINAEALYLFRQKVRAVKVFGLELSNGSRILLIRDQAEGFYANTTYTISKGRGKIQFQGQYTRRHQRDVFRYALSAAEKFMKGRPYEKWAMYKHHLFADVFEHWIKSVDKNFIAYQPDNGLSQLYANINTGQTNDVIKVDTLIVCSNEVGDMIFEAVLEPLNIEPKLELYSRNVYCTPPFSTNFVEYQTVHGSADDIANTEYVLPYATLRIAADIAENYMDVNRAKNRLEMAISECKRKEITNTSAIVNEIFSYFNIAGI